MAATSQTPYTTRTRSRIVHALHSQALLPSAPWPPKPRSLVSSDGSAPRASKTARAGNQGHQESPRCLDDSPMWPRGDR
eukprot:7269007-Pyramimonas_sp.AAC.1